jgi:acetate---CoA ligase (ADP-forming)
MVDDPNTEAVATFIEGIRDAPGFLKACRRARELGKPILVYKTGTSESGRRAVTSHTAALAGDDALYDAVFRANGVIRIRDLQLLVDASVALSWQPLPAGPRVAVVSASGGVCSVTADECARLGLELPLFSDETVEQIARIIPAFGKSQNPIDVTAGVGNRPSMIPDIVRLVLEEPTVDSVLVMLTTNAGPAALEMARGISEVAYGSKKPVIVSRVGADALAPDAVEHYQAHRIPLFPMPERAVQALSVMVRATQSDPGLTNGQRH